MLLTTDSRSPGVRSANPASRECLLAVGVAVALTIVATTVAAATFWTYYDNPADHWRELQHDRASHYLFGLDLGLALRALDPLQFLVRLEQIRDWVPLHPLVLGLVLGVGGVDHRLATLPSLMGWVLAIVMTGLIARRLVADTLGGLTAAAVAATFAISSPYFLEISADVMLEGLGAGLTALAIWLYLRARYPRGARHPVAALDAPQEVGRWRALALTLTLLFFEKQNYWLLTVVALALAVMSEAPREWFVRAREFAAGIDARRAVRAGVKDPLLVAVAAIGVVVIVIVLNGPRPFHIFGRTISLYPPRNPMTLAWVLLVIRMAIAWYRNRAAFDAWLGPIGRAMVYWQAVPIGLFLLLPHRLQYLTMYVSSANSFPAQRFDPAFGAWAYTHFLFDDYHAAYWSGALAVILAVFAATGWWRSSRFLASGVQAPLILLVLSAIAVVVHPNVNMRYLASWIFTLWVCAGVGAGLLTAMLAARVATPLRAALAAAAVAALVIAHVYAEWSPTYHRASRAANRAPRDFDLAAAYLPATAGLKDVGFVLSFGKHYFMTSTVREQCRCFATADWPLPPIADRAAVRDVVLAWVRDTTAERIVMIDTFERNDPWEVGWTRTQALGMYDAMMAQRRFELTQTIALPAYPAQIWIWSPRAAR